MRSVGECTPPFSCTESPQMPCWHRCQWLPAYTDFSSLGGVGVPLPATQHQGPCQICSPVHINHPQKVSPLPPRLSSPLPPPLPFTLPACCAQFSHRFMLSCSLTVWHSSAHYYISTFYHLAHSLFEVCVLS